MAEEKKARVRNRQVERTRGWIKEAFFQLVEEKPFEKISVQDIIDKAGIARRTFYYNYEDKDDVALEYLARCMTITAEETKAAGRPQRIVLSLKQDFIEKNRDLFYKFSDNRVVMRRFRSLFANYVTRIAEKRPTGMSDKDYMFYRVKLCYQFTGVMGVITQWYITKSKIPLERLSTLLNTITNPREDAAHNVPPVIVRVE
jgi:AcrR family transcriptional regulator